MNAQYKAELLQILATDPGTVKLSLNTPVEESFSNVYEVLIHECSSSLIRELVTKGYSCFMTAKGLCVERY